MNIHELDQRSTETQSSPLASRRTAVLAVIGCLLALATSSGAVVAFALSMFIAPMGDEFHWTRTDISLGYSIMTLGLAFSAPFAGRVFDYYGVRRTLLFLVPLFAAAIASLSLLPPSLPAYLGFFGVAGVLGAFHSSIPYIKVVSGWFDRRRGIAIGVTMSGVAVGGILLTQTVRFVMERAGWRDGFIALGAIILILGFSAVLFLVHEKPTPVRALDVPLDVSTSLSGTTVAKAIRDPAFWIILLFVFCMSMTVNGIAASAAAILNWKGASTGEAAKMLAILAGASFVGRLGTGFILDRVFAPYIAASICTITIAGIALLSSVEGSTASIVGLAAIGFSLGAETDVIAYMLGRYCGLRSFGALFGITVGIFALAPAFGIPLLAMSFDHTQSYATTMGGFAVAVAIAAITTLQLGPYRFLAEAD
ncbi:MFS transporter [Ferribacterium limneticum]|uniref:MFS transporter n=1 Tax=Ferribacterium limneticum TaxID=76259 RepID=UPI001CFB37FB|nr:MFS transporter [Ferribacterium limneticum]UCV17792.1 MFS transporter [Ferribacterium limneticum]